MNDYLIKKYVTLNNIKEYAKKEGIFLEDYETNVIYKYILDNYKKINKEYDFSDLKNKVKDNTYNKIIELFNKYKKNLD